VEAKELGRKKVSLLKEFIAISLALKEALAKEDMVSLRDKIDRCEDVREKIEKIDAVLEKLPPTENREELSMLQELLRRAVQINRECERQAEILLEKMGDNIEKIEKTRGAYGVIPKKAAKFFDNHV